MAKSKSFNAWMARDNDGSKDVVFTLGSPPKMGRDRIWNSNNAITRVCGDIAPRSTTFLGLKDGQKQRVRITVEVIDE